MDYKFDSRTVFDHVDRVFEQAEDTFNKVFTSPIWNILEHPDFPFVSVDSTTNRARNFPPYNIIELDGGQVRLDIAVAGYTKNRLKVELEGNALNIRGLSPKEVPTVAGAGEQTADHDFVVPGAIRKQGISNTSFLCSFTMQPHTEVNGVRLHDGILSILVSTKKPEVTSKTTFEIK